MLALTVQRLRFVLHSKFSRKVLARNWKVTVRLYQSSVIGITPVSGNNVFGHCKHTHSLKQQKIEPLCSELPLMQVHSCEKKLYEVSPNFATDTHSENASSESSLTHLTMHV